MRAYLKTLIKKGPVPLVKWGQVLYNLLPPSVRYGKEWNEAVSLLMESDHWDEQALTKYQEERLECLMHHCYDNVPYYKEIFQQHGLKPRDIQSVDDLKKLPTLNKETVRKRKQDLLATNFATLGKHPAHTSGSSGTALEFYMDNSTRPTERALVLRHLSWLGYKRGDRTAVIKALPLADPKKCYQYFPGSRELRLSFHNADDKRLETMVDELERFKPAFINAWPSCLYVLAKWMERNGRFIPPPKYIVTSSENQYPHIREKIEQIFGSKTIDWYGQEESCAAAIQCELAQGYHIQMEMGIVELVSVPRGDNCHEIVGTCLHNLVMPFIRYKTGDLAVKAEGLCACGRKSPTIQEIMGREIDFVLTPEKNVISPLILNFSFLNTDEIKEAQIIQEDLNTLRILIAPWTEISLETKEKLMQELRSRLESPGMELILQEIEGIPCQAGCYKKPFLISRVDVDKYL
jgi:phenylacetate-coenzyme A ligase PaaK-like adenylate-forming protein